MKVTLQSQFTLYPLSIQKDKKNYIVEEPVSGDFFEMPVICIDAIERINKGQTLGEIEIELREKYPTENVDMIEFGGQLIELGLVQEIDGEKTPQKKDIKASRGFKWIPSSVGRFFFNGITNKIYLLLLLINSITYRLEPWLIPSL